MLEGRPVRRRLWRLQHWSRRSVEVILIVASPFEVSLKASHGDWKQKEPASSAGGGRFA